MRPYCRMRRVALEIAELIKDWPCLVKGSIRKQVNTISTYSKKMGPQGIFCAIKGERVNGCQFIEEAIHNGAVCIVVEDEKIFDEIRLEQTVIWVPNILKFVSYAAAALSRFASEAIGIVAITGTNGKTTTAHFVYQLLTALNKKVINIGTNGVVMNGDRLNIEEHSLTTMKPVPFHNLVQQAIHSGYDVIVTEASSQGLAQHRLDYTNIDIGVFLNLGEDHIEWHGSVENYKRAKSRLIQLCDHLIVNERDSFCRSIGHMSKKQTMFYSQNSKSDVYFEKLTPFTNNDYIVQYKEQYAVITFPFEATYVIENGIAAISVCLKFGFTLQQLKPIVEKLQLPQGRYQRYSYKGKATIIIDYAHTPDSLKAFLQSLKLKRRELSIVFSCGGERDHSKREKMGKIASSFCRKVYLTTDNCRSENPVAINEQIAKGFFDNQVYEMILNRKDAICRAIEQCEEGETIVIVGKGHENYQIIGNEVLKHSDIEVVQSISGVVKK